VAFASDILRYGGIILPLIALILLACGPLTRYFPLFLYLFSLIATTVAETWAIWKVGVRDPLYFNIYWGGEFLLDLLMFFLVISLTSRALEGSPLRPKVARLMTVITLIALAAPFIIFDSEVFGRHWNQSVGQLFNFGAALMNMALWSALVLAKRRDRQLLIVSAGLGVTVAAAALTLGVRQFTAQDDGFRTVVDWVHRLSQCVGPLMWCYAFRPPRPSVSLTTPADPTPHAS
jgi:hypothetical protein